MVISENEQSESDTEGRDKGIENGTEPIQVVIRSLTTNRSYTVHSCQSRKQKRNANPSPDG